MHQSFLLLEKAVFVTGCRTPFVKSSGSFKNLTSLDLAVHSVRGLLDKTKIDPKVIDHIIWGNVVLQPSAHNCAREIVVDLHLPSSITAHSTSMACMSGLNAIIQAFMMIESNHADVIIAGGSDSMSNPPVTLPQSVTHGLLSMPKKGIRGFLHEAGMNPLKWLPAGTPLTERSTGKTMGWHADMMAEINQIPRSEQEELALASHKHAAEAEAKGYLSDEMTEVTLPKRSKGGKGKKQSDIIISKDELIQRNLEKMKTKMPTMSPVFRKTNGTVTAATSSALTDGACATLIMSKRKAKELNLPTDVTLKSWQFCGYEPFPQLLLAPALGWGPALAKAQLTADDIDLFEVHEAFAAQVLATIKCLSSPEFFEKHTGRKEAVIKKQPFDMSKLNVNGSSIALGHPFAATGGRIATSLANELRRTGKRHGLVSICAAGGLGGVAVFEHTPK